MAGLFLPKSSIREWDAATALTEHLPLIDELEQARQATLFGPPVRDDRARPQAPALPSLPSFEELMGGPSDAAGGAATGGLTPAAAPAPAPPAASPARDDWAQPGGLALPSFDDLYGKEPEDELLGVGGRVSSATPRRDDYAQNPSAEGGNVTGVIRSAATEFGVDPGIFDRQLRQEGAYSPDVWSGGRQSSAGARGPGQFMPATGNAVADRMGVPREQFWSDPVLQVRGAAFHMRELLDRYGGDYRKALAAYNAGPGAVDSGAAFTFGETQRYLANILQGEAPVAPPRAPGAPSDAIAAQQARAAVPPGEGDYPSEDIEGISQVALNDPDKWALCGPVAAVMAATRRGGQWTVEQAKKIASGLDLWTADLGMRGLQAEAALLRNLGLNAETGAADRDRLAQDAAGGNTPIISTNRHYYILDGYDPSTGKFDTVTTGPTMKGGRRWMTLDEIAAQGGGIQGAAYIDNPASPNPGTVASPPSSEVPPVGAPADLPTENVADPFDMGTMARGMGETFTQGFERDDYRRRPGGVTETAIVDPVLEAQAMGPAQSPGREIVPIAEAPLGEMEGPQGGGFGPEPPTPTLSPSPPPSPLRQLGQTIGDAISNALSPLLGGAARVAGLREEPTPPPASDFDVPPTVVPPTVPESLTPQPRAIDTAEGPTVTGGLLGAAGRAAGTVFEPERAALGAAGAVREQSIADTERYVELGARIHPLTRADYERAAANPPTPEEIEEYERLGPIVGANVAHGAGHIEGGLPGRAAPAARAVGGIADEAAPAMGLEARAVESPLTRAVPSAPDSAFTEQAVRSFARRKMTPVPAEEAINRVIRTVPAFPPRLDISERVEAVRMRRISPWISAWIDREGGVYVLKESQNHEETAALALGKLVDPNNAYDAMIERAGFIRLQLSGQPEWTPTSVQIGSTVSPPQVEALSKVARAVEERGFAFNWEIGDAWGEDWQSLSRALPREAGGVEAEIARLRRSLGLTGPPLAEDTPVITAAGSRQAVREFAETVADSYPAWESGVMVSQGGGATLDHAIASVAIRDLPDREFGLLTVAVDAAFPPTWQQRWLRSPATVELVVAHEGDPEVFAAQMQQAVAALRSAGYTIAKSSIDPAELEVIRGGLQGSGVARGAAARSGAAGADPGAVGGRPSDVGGEAPPPGPPALPGQDLPARPAAQPADLVPTPVPGGTTAAPPGAAARVSEAPAIGLETRAVSPPEPAPTFYSALRRTIEEKMPNRASADQIGGILRGSAVKPDELKWTGFDDFLNEAKKAGRPVTKQEALDFLAANEVRVEEVVKGAFDRPRLEELQSIERRTPAEEQEYHDLIRAAGRQPRYAIYQLPGGENYRELLLTLPQGSADQNRVAQEMFGKPYRELNRAAQELVGTKTQQAYRSGHWDEPNVLAHVRFNERVDADGKRVLFVEEIQSDWHQAGRKQGYRDPELEARRAELTARLRAFDAENRSAFAAGDRARADRAAKQAVAIRRELDAVPEGVPAAPFAKTWPELAMKRTLRWAAENGFDRVAWTTGQQQAERFDLSKRVDQLLYDPSQKELIGRKGGAQEFAERVPPEKVPDYIGQELAAKLFVAPTNEWGMRSLSGQEISIGGEGMKGFYDRILPEVANKLGKKFGARVGQAEIPVERWSAEHYPQYRDQAEFEAAVPSTVRNERAWSLDVTPRMRESVVDEGQPLFMGARPPDLAATTAGRAVLGAGAGGASEYYNPSESEEQRLGRIGLGAAAGALMGRGGRRAVGQVVDPATARRLPGGVRLPDDPMFRSAVENVGGRVTDEGIELHLARAQKPAQVGGPAVRGGVFYEAGPPGTPSSYLRPVDAPGGPLAGGTQEVAGPSLFKNPLDAGDDAIEYLDPKTLGVPVSARELNQMAQRAYRLPDEQAVRYLRDMLTDFGGDPDAADLMVRNLDRNERISAVKENILAAAARRRGHDAIISLQFGRDNRPEISELMDLREGAYPGPAGEFSLRPEFEAPVVGNVATPTQLFETAREVLRSKPPKDDPSAGFAREVSKAVLRGEQQRGPNALDWAKTIGYSAMIGPTAFATNVAGNAVDLLYNIPKRAVLTAAETKRPVESALIQAHAALSGPLEGIAEVANVLRGGRAGWDVKAYPRLSERIENPIGKAIAASLEAGGRVFTQTPDAFFGSIGRDWGKRIEAARIAAEEGLSGRAMIERADEIVQAARRDERTTQALMAPTSQRVNEAAEAFRQKLVFQGPMGEVGEQVRQLLTGERQGAAGQAVGAGLHLLVPFFGTLYHLSARLAERTPWVGLAAPNKGLEKAYDQVVGAGIAGGIALLAVGGGITGSGPKDPDKRRMQEAEGWKRNSFLVGGVWVPNTAAGPWGPIMNLAGEIGDAYRYNNEANAGKMAQELARRVGNVAGDFYYLRGLVDFVQAMQDPDGFLQGYSTSTARRLLPYAATTEAAARATDPYERRAERMADVGPAESLRQGLARSVPGARESVPVARDVLGQPVENVRQGPAAVLPAFGREREDPTIRLFAQAGVDIGPPPNAITLSAAGGGAEIRLTREERERYQEAMAAHLRQYAKPGDSPERLTSVLEAARNRARTAVIQSIPTNDPRRRKAS